VHKEGGKTAMCRSTEEMAQVPNILKAHVREGRMQEEGKVGKIE
jgi:hypothetical protein